MVLLLINKFNNSELNNNSQTFVLTPEEIKNKELSELIKISLYSKDIFERVRDISEIKPNQYLWITNENFKKFQNLKIIYKSKQITKWVLAKKLE